MGNVREQKGGDQIYMNVLTYILKTVFCSFQCLSILMPKESQKRKRKKNSNAMLFCYSLILFCTEKLFKLSFMCSQRIWREIVM
jgi:hypothetical protein